MKTINFPYDVMTVNIYDERDVFLEVKPIEPGLPPIREVLINIGFFVCENNTRKYIDNLDPPAEIHVKFPDGEELKLAYFDKETRNWEDYAFDVAVAVKFNNIVPINENLVYYDECGDDKLSFQDEAKISIEKSKSINYISETLITSKHYKNKIIKKKIVLLLLNNIIALIHTGKQKKEYINENIKNLKTWESVYFVTLIKITTFVNVKIGLPLLRRIRNNMQKMNTT